MNRYVTASVLRKPLWQIGCEQECVMDVGFAAIPCSWWASGFC
jgi:hypothetical protein